MDRVKLKSISKDFVKGTTEFEFMLETEKSIFQTVY